MLRVECRLVPACVKVPSQPNNLALITSLRPNLLKAVQTQVDSHETAKNLQMQNHDLAVPL